MLGYPKAGILDGMNRHQGLMLSILLTASQSVAGAAIDEIKVEVSHDACEGFGAKQASFIVYATNSSENQSVEANFKYDSSPAQQHFILFDASLNPITDRFPKFYTRRLAPRETATIGCTLTYRASPQAPGPLPVPLVITKQSAAYVEPNAPVASPGDPRASTVFFLQGGINECSPGAKPPGMLFLLNLHPYARLSVSMSRFDERGNRTDALTSNLAPLSTMRAGCSNGISKPGPITDETLEVTAGIPTIQPAAPPAVTKVQTPEQHREPQSEPVAPALAPLSLDAIFRTQNVCAGSVASGWIKINDAWNPTVCGKPTVITYNVWTIQQFEDQPIGAIIHACKGAVPAGWATAGTVWNPTVCGHPAINQPNVMVIKRLN
jgi:hypothetical protein